MKKILSFLVLLISVSAGAQYQLNNALVIGQLDKPEDRFSVEINVTELFASAGIKAMASLNVLKLGSDPDLLGSDSVINVLKSKGIDTYVLVFVKGYDKKFKATTLRDDLITALNTGSLFPLYRDEITSITFEFQFFRNGQMIGADVLRCSSVSNRDAVVKKLRKGLKKKIDKKWKK
jgi:hypothetical protein